MHLMIVEDLAIMRRVIINCLKNIGFSHFVEAEDGQDAWLKMQKQRIDFLITDWNMPHMDGMELVQNIRNDPTLQEIPILVITTRGSKEDVFDAAKANINGYIVKPFTTEVLQQKIFNIMKNVGKPID